MKREKLIADILAFEAKKFTFIPSLFLRPHHFYNSFVRQALVTSQYPERMASEWEAIFKGYRQVYGNEDGYYEDILGDTPESSGLFRQGLENYFSQLGALPDTSFIQLDRSPDGICTSCATGNHCSAMNYKRSPKRARELAGAKTDEGALRSILVDLNAHHFLEDIHFKRVHTSHILFDFGGGHLHASSHVSAHEVSFPAVIVLTGALRALIPRST